jgi:cyclase
MNSLQTADHISRRELLRRAGLVTGGAIVLPFLPATSWAETLFLRQAQPDALAQRRAAMAAVPIEATKLADNVTMLGGPGGNVIVLNGADGKIVVDSFVQPVWDKLKSTLDGMGKVPVKMLIDTHWHFDHTDNNENFHKAGATVVAHENTRKRLTETHDLLGMHFTPSPPGALPTDTFKDRKSVDANGERIDMAHVQPAHTDTDIYIHLSKANVLHLGDLFFNGGYPFIDASTGGNINGMITAADGALKLADSSTKIVPGHGPLGDRASLSKYRDMMVTVRDRVLKLKKAGQTVAQVVAANPTVDLDGTWGKGFMQAKDFLPIVYNTVK